MHAALRARAERSRDTILGIAELFDKLGDTERAGQVRTHFEDPETIGKFGFGLPKALINQTRRVEVSTKTSDAKKISMAWLDINPENVSETGLQTVGRGRAAGLHRAPHDVLSAGPERTRGLHGDSLFRCEFDRADGARRSMRQTQGDSRSWSRPFVGLVSRPFVAAMRSRRGGGVDIRRNTSKIEP